MLVIPLSHAGQNRLANDINQILSKVRRGCAMARQDSQANPAVNMMVDLPEGIDFEINAIYQHQSSSYQRQVTMTNSGNNTQAEASLDFATESDVENGNGADLSSESSLNSEIESGSSSGSRSTIRSESTSSSASRSASESESSSRSASEFGSESASESSSESASESSSESESESSLRSQSSSESRSESSSGKREQRAGSGRQIQAFDDETGATGSQLAFPTIPLPTGGTSCSAT